MSISAKTLNNIQKTLRNTSHTKATKKLKKDDSSLLQENTSAKKTYILEGGIIKVYVTDENGCQKCVKQIPLSAAPLSILMKVEVTNGIDAMLLQDAIEELLNSDEASINYDSNGSVPEFNNDSNEHQ